MKKTQEIPKYCGECPFLHQPVGRVLGYELNPIGTRHQENRCLLDLHSVETYKKIRLTKDMVSSVDYHISKASIGKLVTKRPHQFGKIYHGISLNDGLDPKKTKLCLAFTKHIVESQQ